VDKTNDDCSLNFYDNPRLYDLVYGTFDSDSQFYLSLIEKYGQPVLELMCGSGRLTIPFTQKGIDITGLDMSESMLNYGREKAAKLGVELDLISGDCRDFALDRKYNFIFIPYSSIQLLTRRSDLEACFTAVKAHLETGGRFMIDIFNPNIELLNRDSSKKYPVRELVDDEVYGKVVVSEQPSYDAKNQTLSVRWFFDIERLDQQLENTQKIRVLFPQEIEMMLNYYGFTIEHKYGDYDFSDYNSDSPKQLIVCKKL